MIKIQVDVDNIAQKVSVNEYEAVKKEVEEQYHTLISRKGAGNDFLGWLSLPADTSDDLMNRIETEAASLRGRAEVLVVLGIGGSYLGSRAVIEALGHHFEHLRKRMDKPLVIYAGQNISEDYLANLIGVLDTCDYALCVISKSGTTTETAIAFRILKNHIEQKYGHKEACSRIMAITDMQRGALKKMADLNGYATFVIPDDVGGRFSVLTPVGLYPIAAAGFDIRKLISGARQMQQYLVNADIETNPAIAYAAARNALYRQGCSIEVMITYEPCLVSFTEWWKQLYGESEGKHHKGIFPAGVNFTTDLHSMGQYIQDGLRILFETVLTIGKSSHKVVIPAIENDPDGLNYIAGKRLSEVNRMAANGTLLAHLDGGVPNIHISIDELNEECLGQLIYFYEFACALSGYTLGVNPFDQPGVEAYKNNMFALLGKPGYESESSSILEKINKKSQK